VSPRDPFSIIHTYKVNCSVLVRRQKSSSSTRTQGVRFGDVTYQLPDQNDDGSEDDSVVNRRSWTSEGQTSLHRSSYDSRLAPHSIRSFESGSPGSTVAVKLGSVTYAMLLF
jgi:hypothetical protein